MTRAKGRVAVDRARRPLTRVRRRVVHVFTEGEVTEPGWIDFVSEHGDLKFADHPFEIRLENANVSSGRRKPLPLVEDAVDCLDRVEKAAVRAGLNRDQDWNWPQVWCFFDRDDHKDIDRAFRRAQEAGVHIAYSHPCFELWRLLHYQDYTSGFGGVCGDAASLLRKQPGFAATYGIRSGSVSEKAAKHIKPDQFTTPSADRNRFERARQFATKLVKQRSGADPARWDPYTDVYRFVEDGLGVSKY